jgi:hypothetical protein
MVRLIQFLCPRNIFLWWDKPSLDLELLNKILVGQAGKPDLPEFRPPALDFRGSLDLPISSVFV